MKRLVLVLALLGSTPAWGAIAFVSASHTICSQATASSGTACTLTAPTTAGNLVIAGLTWSSSNSINDVVGNVTSSYFFPYAQVCNGSGSCSAILICRDCSALTTVTPHFNGQTNYNLSVEEYSGVTAIGVTRTATGSSTAPGVAITAGDANDWLVAVTASPASAGVPTAGTGNLRDAGRTGSSGVASAVCDNTTATAGSLSCAATAASGAWSAAGVELRTTYATTYIWPDCDLTHPCVIHEKDTVSLGTGTDTLTGPFKITVPPTLSGNLMKLTITHPGAATINSVSDDQSNTWTTGATARDSSNGEITEVRYVCGAATGTSVISVAYSSAIVDGDIAQFSYDEVSGIAPSSCGDGSSGSGGGVGVLNPGPIATTSGGDMIFTFGIAADGWAENGNQAGVAQPDDNSAKIAENDFDQFMSMVQVQGSAGTANPTMYANALDVNNTGLHWNIVSQAFRASSGAGTQPSGIHVVTDQHFLNWNGLGWSPLPSNGNVVVFSTSNPSAGWGMANLADNYGATYIRTPYTDANVDPQQFSACLGSNVSARDRIFSYTADRVQTHVEIYTIAGAKNATGTGCVGTTVNHYVSTQGSIKNDNIVSDVVIKPTINGGANSVIFATSYVGTGPPTGMCISGGVTPPTCTGQSAGVIFNSIYATGMTDQSSWSTGDPYAFFYTNSTSSRSMDYLMANGTSGTALYGAAIEIFGAGTTAGPVMLTPTITVTPSAPSITRVQPLSVTVAVKGGSGSPTPTGTVTLSGGGYASAATTLSSGNATIGIPAGSLAIASDTLTVSYTPDSGSSSTYNTATGTSSVTVTQATPTVSSWPTASAISFGQTLASSTLTGGAASVPGSFAWTTPSTALGMGASSQSVTFTPTDATDYTNVTGQVSVTVANAAKPTVSVWPIASAITYRQTLASSTLTGGTASVPGTFVWTTPSAVPGAGTPAESVTFTPTDATDYTTVTGQVSVTVNKATPTVSAWPIASAITYGQTLASSTLTGGAPSVPGIFAWATPSTAPGTGTSLQSVTFTPTDAADNNGATGQVSVTVNKATPTVSAWPIAAAISYAQTLASSTLTGGVGSVPGTFVWTTPTTAPGTGTSSQSVIFTPTDATDYNAVTGQVSVSVNQATPAVLARPIATAISYAQTLASSTLTGGVASVPGTFAWATPATAPGTGTSAQSVTFTPTDVVDYATVTAQVSVTVNKAMPAVLARPIASAIAYAQTLASSTLTGGVASVPGTFAWTTPTAVPGAGTPSESVTFTPTDATDYNLVTQTVQLTVTKAILAVTATNASVPYNQAIPNLTYTIAGYVNGDPSSVVSGAPLESTTATKGSLVGTYPITIVQGMLAAINYNFLFQNGTLTVTSLGATATPVFTPAAGTYTSTQTVTIWDATAGAAIYYTTDGTPPTISSAKYTGGVAVPATETIEAIGVAPGYSQSAPASALYTINIPVATAPSVATMAVTNLGRSSATLNGTVTANNATTQYWFAYGTSNTALTGTTIRAGALTGTSATPVNATLTGLRPFTTYYFRVFASNAVGTTSGSVLSFTTR